MIGFKQFLTEMPHSNAAMSSKYRQSDLTVKNRGRGKAYIGAPEQEDNSDYDVHKKVSSTDSHDFYKLGKGTDDKYTKFVAVDKKTKKVHMSVTGDMHGTEKNKHFAVDYLKASEGNTLKAHEFYHHLIHAGHVNTLVSDDSHSPGAKKVWHKLSQMPNIKMDSVYKKHDYRRSRVTFKKSGAKIHKDWDQNYSSDPDDERYNTRFAAKADIKRGV